MSPTTRSAAVTHDVSAVAELNDSHGYPWRPVCSCGWAHQWRYASKEAAQVMAASHRDEVTPMIELAVWVETATGCNPDPAGMDEFAMMVTDCDQCHRSVWTARLSMDGSEPDRWCLNCAAA